jgi:antitoxin ParD1/3/4
MNIAIKTSQADFINGLLESGRYKTAEEIVETAVNLLADQEADQANWKAETREKLEMGLAELDRGESFTLEQVITRLQEKIRRERQAQKDQH